MTVGDTVGHLDAGVAIVRTRALIGEAIFDALLAQKNRAAIANLVQGIGEASSTERAALAKFWRDPSAAAPSGLASLPETPERAAAADPPASRRAPADRTEPAGAVVARPTTARVLVGDNALDAIEGERADERRLTILQRLDQPLAIREMEVLVEKIAAVLARFPWFADGVEEVFIRPIRVGHRLGRPTVRFPPVLLAGPAGIGKSSFLAAMIDGLGGAPYLDTLAGVSDALSITGSSPTFQAAQPSLPVRAMMETNCANPMVVLDEIDKVGTDTRIGHPHDALLPLLEPVTAGAYRDRFIDRLIDASRVSFAATANDTTCLSSALRSRLTIVTSPGPGPEHASLLIAGFRDNLAKLYQVEAAAIPDGGDVALEKTRRALLRSADIRPIERAWRAHVERLLDVLG